MLPDGNLKSRFKVFLGSHRKKGKPPILLIGWGTPFQGRFGLGKNQQIFAFLYSIDNDYFRSTQELFLFLGEKT